MTFELNPESPTPARKVTRKKPNVILNYYYDLESVYWVLCNYCSKHVSKDMPEIGRGSARICLMYLNNKQNELFGTTGDVVLRRLTIISRESKRYWTERLAQTYWNTAMLELGSHALGLHVSLADAYEEVEKQMTHELNAAGGLADACFVEWPYNHFRTALDAGLSKKCVPSGTLTITQASELYELPLRDLERERTRYKDEAAGDGPDKRKHEDEEAGGEPSYKRPRTLETTKSANTSQKARKARKTKRK